MTLKIHIIGSGPTGLSIAYELTKLKNVEIHMYDKDEGIGGTWLEDNNSNIFRSYHSSRMVFKPCFVNTLDFFNQLKINWNDVFIKTKDDTLKIILKLLPVVDWLTLVSCILEYLYKKEKSKMITVYIATRRLTNKGKKLINCLCLMMDGVTSGVMTMFEFTQNINHVVLSQSYTQKGNANVLLFSKIRTYLMNRNVKFNFNSKLDRFICYDSHSCNLFFENKKQIHIQFPDQLVICSDSISLYTILTKSTILLDYKNLIYGNYFAINLFLHLDTPLTTEYSELEFMYHSTFNQILTIVPNTNNCVLSCVICDIQSCLHTHPIQLFELCYLDIQNFFKLRINIKNYWYNQDSYWENDKWNFKKSASIITTKGPFPMFSSNHNSISFVGNFNDRSTPFTSIESSIELSRIYMDKKFPLTKNRRLINVYTLTNLFKIILSIFISIFLLKLKKNIKSL